MSKDLPGGSAPWILGAFLVLLYLGTLNSYPLYETDEGRYIEIPREMLASGDFVTPHLNGVVYQEKPPLYYWLNAASLKAFGALEFSARFWSGVFGLLSLGLVYLLGRSIGGARHGILAASILALSPLHFGMAHVSSIDGTLAFFVTLTLACFWLAQGMEAREARWIWWGGFAASALAVMTKGLIGIVIPGAVIFLYLLFSRRWALLARIPWVTGSLVFLALAVPWHVLAALRNPDFLWFYFIHEHLLRYATTIADRRQPIWFFVPILLAGFLPASGLLFAAISRLREGRLRALFQDRPDRIFLLCWAGFVFVFFSASQSKLVPYILPAMAPIALLLAEGLERALRKRDAWTVWGGVFGLFFCAVVGGVELYASLGVLKDYSGFSRLNPLLLAAGSGAVILSLAAMIPWIGRKGERSLVVSALGSVCLLGGLVPAASAMAPGHTAKAVAAHLAPLLKPGDRVYSYNNYVQTLPPYLGRRVGLVRKGTELQPGILKLPEAERAEWFPEADGFKRIWESDETVYIVLPRNSIAVMERQGLHPGTLLFQEDRYLLMVNHASGPPPPKENAP